MTVVTIQVQDAKRGGIRWAVGSQTGPRSSTWRVWGSKKGDVYLAVRNLGGVVKASFHRDRRCQVGFTDTYEKTARARFGSQSRHWERWRLPNQPLVRAAQIVVPASELRSFQSNDTDQMKWLPQPAQGCVSVVSLFIQEPPQPVRAWPALETGAEPLGFIQTATRTTWIIYSSNSLDAATIAHVREARARAIQLPGMREQPWEPGVRMILWGGDHPDLFFIELAAGMTSAL